jgi:hypothetical protein
VQLSVRRLVVSEQDHAANPYCLTLRQSVTVLIFRGFCRLSAVTTKTLERAGNHRSFLFKRVKAGVGYTLASPR